MALDLKEVTEENGQQPRVYYTGHPEAYEKAKAQVEDTQGNVFREKAWWQACAFVALCVIACLAIALVILGRQPSHEPVYVKVNQEGQLQIVGWDAYEPSEAEVKADLMYWMRCVRGIPMDQEVLKRCWAHVPMFLLARTQAYTVIDAYFKQYQPGKALWEKAIDVEEMVAFPHPDGRWQVEWTEKVYTLVRSGGAGRLESTKRYASILLIQRHQPTKRTQIELHGEPVNPRGIFVVNLSWSQ